MRFGRFTVSIVLVSVAVGFSSQPAVEKPQWHDAPFVFVFGNVKREGLYAFQVDQPITLAQLAASAGLPTGEAVIVSVYRRTEKGCKTIQIDSNLLNEDAKFPLEVGDFIHVTGP